jgi:hypothetical protein
LLTGEAVTFLNPSDLEFLAYPFYHYFKSLNICNDVRQERDQSPHVNAASQLGLLRAAAYTNSKSVVKSLLAKGCPPDTQVAKNETEVLLLFHSPIYLAAHQGNKDTVEMLLASSRLKVKSTIYITNQQ